MIHQLNETSMKPAVEIKAEDLQVGFTFLSKGSKMTVARIKQVYDDKITFFVLQHIMNSYTTVTINKSEIVYSA